MVDDPADYTWSSYQSNALGKPINLLTPHPLYLKLGRTDAERQQRYRELFRFQVDGELLNDIRKAANKGLVLGNDRFVAEVEALTGKELHEKKRGRPLGWSKIE